MGSLGVHERRVMRKAPLWLSRARGPPGACTGKLLLGDEQGVEMGLRAEVAQAVGAHKSGGPEALAAAPVQQFPDAGAQAVGVRPVAMPPGTRYNDHGSAALGAELLQGRHGLGRGQAEDELVHRTGGQLFHASQAGQAENLGAAGLDGMDRPRGQGGALEFSRMMRPGLPSFWETPATAMLRGRNRAWSVSAGAGRPRKVIAWRESPSSPTPSRATGMPSGSITTGFSSSNWPPSFSRSWARSHTRWR